MRLFCSTLQSGYQLYLSLDEVSISIGPNHKSQKTAIQYGEQLVIAFSREGIQLEHSGLYQV